MEPTCPAKVVPQGGSVLVYLQKCRTSKTSPLTILEMPCPENIGILWGPLTDLGTNMCQVVCSGKGSIHICKERRPLYIFISSSTFLRGKKLEVNVIVLGSLELKIWTSVPLNILVTKKRKSFSVACCWHYGNITLPSIYFRMGRNWVLWFSLQRAQAKQISNFDLSVTFVQ